MEDDQERKGNNFAINTSNAYISQIYGHEPGEATRRMFVIEDQETQDQRDMKNIQDQLKKQQEQNKEILQLIKKQHARERSEGNADAPNTPDMSKKFQGLMEKMLGREEKMEGDIGSHLLEMNSQLLEKMKKLQGQMGEEGGLGSHLLETNSQTLEKLKKMHAEVTNSAGEVGPSFSRTRKSIWKTDLNYLLMHEENIDDLQSRGEFYQALGAHEGFKKFNRSKKDIRFLIRYCLTLMLTKRDTQAKELFENILTKIKNMGETFHSVLELAVRAIKSGKNFDAIMLCMFAAKMADMGNLTVIESAHKSKCMTVLRDALDNVHARTKRAKPFFRRYCVEAVRPLFEDVMRTATGSGGSKNPIDLKIATFHCMEIIQLYADDDEGRAKTTERALDFLKETYGEEVHQRKWFGVFSHNLGCTYLKLSRNVEAAEKLVQAYSVLKQAIDFDDEDDEERNMTCTINMLKCTGIGGLIDIEF